MNLTATEPQSTARYRGTIFYDGECNLCTGGAMRFGPMLRRRGFELAPLQSPHVAQQLGIDPNELLHEVRLLAPDGRVLGGADAITAVARHVWWAWPLWLVSHAPGVRALLRFAYREFVPYRYCVVGRCGTASPVMRATRTLITWLPALVLPVIALLTWPVLPPWAFMWLMAGATFGAGKWITWRRARPELRRDRARSLAYMFAWPGMNADQFLDRFVFVEPPPARRWLWPILKTALGALLVWGVARLFMPDHPLVAGWCGMVGLILLLHFGSFELIALTWQRAGVTARPIMDRAGTATSVTEFWGRRWNRGFSDLVRRSLFAPAQRRFGAAAALLATFAFSGLIHELVITLPARGGWGGPLAYFLIQGIAILFERTRIARRAGLGRGPVGRAFVALTTIAPLPLLFPPPFVERVILPFMHLIGAFADRVPIAIDRADLIFFGGLLHFGILIASALVPQVLDWRRELGKLEPLTRHLVWVHGAFIVLTIVGFGVITTLNATELASGSMLARSLSAFIAIFWLIRLCLQFILFDARPYLTSAALKLGYHGLSVVFTILVLICAWSALAPA